MPVSKRVYRGIAEEQRWPEDFREELLLFLLVSQVRRRGISLHESSELPEQEPQDRQKKQGPHCALDHFSQFLGGDSPEPVCEPQDCFENECDRKERHP